MVSHPTLERVRSLAFGVAAISAAGTLLLVAVGGFHALSTTNGGAREPSLAVLGYVGYPLVTAIAAAAVGGVCSLWSEAKVRRARRKRKADDDRPSTLHVLNDRKRP